MSGYPVDGAHLTRLQREEMVAMFTGWVESRFKIVSKAPALFGLPPLLVGTNAKFNRIFGKTSLQAVQPGVRPPANPTPMTMQTLVVDTLINARNNVDKLNFKQVDFDILQEIASDQGKTHAQFFDEAFFAQLAKGAALPAIPGVDNAIPGGKVVNLGADEEKDPDALADSIAEVLDRMRVENIPDNELFVAVYPYEFTTLLKNDKLVSRDFTTQGADTAMRKLFYIDGVRIEQVVAMPRTPTPDGEHHLLSNTYNNFAYDVTKDDARAVALIGHPRSLMSASAISLSTDIWYNKEEKQHFIDSDIAFGVRPNRPDVCGVVRKAATP